MKYKVYFLLAPMFMIACQEKLQSPVKEVVAVELILHQQTKVNPAVLQNGNSFLQTFASFWKLGKWTELLNMTDKTTIDKYGKVELEKKYKKINLAMKLTLKSMADNGDSTFTLNYSTNVFATRRMLRATVRILPNDSVKLVITDLNNLLE